MVKEKRSIAERLGLIEREPTPQPIPSPEDYPAYEAPQPEVTVDTTQISGDAVIESVYSQGEFTEATSLYRIQAFITSLPKEMPTATKQASIAGILKASGININDLIADGTQRKALLETAEAGLKADNEQRKTETEANIEELRTAIQEAERRMAEDKEATEASCDAIEHELETITSLLEFASGVANQNVGG